MTTAAWVDAGPFRGPPGDPGPAGPAGTLLGRVAIPLNFAVTPLSTWVNVVTMNLVLAVARDMLFTFRCSGQAAGTNSDQWADINVNGTRMDVAQSMRATAGLVALSGTVTVPNMPAGANTVILRAYSVGGYTIGSGELSAVGLGAAPSPLAAVAHVGSAPPANPVVGQLWIDTS